MGTDKLKTILRELKTISDDLKAVIPELPSEQKEYLLTLSNYKSRVNALSPEVNYLFDIELAKVTEDLLLEHKDSIKGNSSLIKSIISGKMARYQGLKDYVDRVNSTINLQSNNLRTVLSYEKELIKNNL